VPKPPYIIDADGSVRQGTTNRAGNDRTLRLQAGELTFIRIDHQTRLQFGPIEVVIETPFGLGIRDTAMVLDPAERSTLGPLLGLYPDSLATASVDDSATLSLTFASGASITVRQDPRYEAWQVNGPDNYLVVCTPGEI
jgi:hypothetical protein